MNGVVIIDKPAGKTSQDVVTEVKKILGVKKAGHTGTLDPMATGVLPVCLNEATKLARFLSDESKEYSAAMLLGVQTETLDTCGKITDRCDRIVPEEEIRQVLAGMVGRIRQTPPAYSAVKFCGKPLYKWARQGLTPPVLSREVEIQHMVIEDISYPLVKFRVVCSKGTYIRTLCADAGELLGCGACLCELRRLRSGFFSEDKAIALTGNSTADKKEKLLAGLLPMSDMLPLLTPIEVDDLLADRLRDGYQPSVEVMKSHVLPFLEAGDMVKFTKRGGCLIAIAEMLVPVSGLTSMEGKSQAIKIVRVFNNGQN